MPFTFNNLDCSPLVIDREFNINNEELLAEFVAKIMLGHFSHVKKIIDNLAPKTLKLRDNEIDLAIAKLESKGKSDVEIIKRDGWIFQIISWLALYSENLGKKFYSQRPHDAPAQHGIDNIGIILGNDLLIESIIITEDKCTENHRVLMPKIWEEFSEFEKNIHINKIVGRVSEIIERIEGDNILENNIDNIYDKNFWRYRVGINRSSSHEAKNKREKLFKGYDNCVTGNNPHRRYASTIQKDDIRVWLECFSKKIIEYLGSQKQDNV